jgi:hypothetical protein
MAEATWVTVPERAAMLREALAANDSAGISELMASLHKAHSPA